MRLETTLSKINFCPLLNWPQQSLLRYQIKFSENTGRENELILALLVVLYAKKNCWDDAQKVGDD